MDDDQNSVVTLKVRVTPEFREKIIETAKENNRSMNAEIVHRLEESFDLANQDPLSYVNDPLVKIHFVGVDLARYDAKMQALRFAIRTIGNSDDTLKDKLLYLLDYTQFEKDSLIAELFQDIQETGLSLDLIPDTNIKAKISEGLAEFAKEMASSSFDEMKNKYPNWGSWN